MGRPTDEERLLSLVPIDGSTISNRNLREHLGWSDERYEQVREQLVERGLVVRGPGPGGTLRRAESEQGGEDEEQDEAEGSAALSRQEKKLLSLIPEDGSTINNRVLREQTGWTDERYEQVREQLVEKGLVVRGPGPGGTLRRAESELGGEDEEQDEAEGSAALSRQEKKLLSLIPEDGSTINNRVLREQTGWTDEKYEQVREQLVEKGLVVRGPGPGGTLRRAESEQGGEDEEQDEAEGSAALSRQEKKLLSLIPEDGSTINNRVLREQTGWTDEKYEQVREQLVERGLVVRGPGPGGTLRRAESEQGGEDEAESSAALSRQEKRLLSLIPEDGSTINNRVLREQTGWTDEKYEQVREQLVEKGLVVRGPGPGGTLRRAESEQGGEDEEQDEAEGSAALSRQEKKLLSLIPEDGSTINNRVLREQTGWTDEKYEQVREQLVEKGLVVRGPGPGGTLRRAESEQGGEDEEQDEAEGSAALSRQEKKLLSLIPEDGSTINNRVLREQTGWTDERYEQVREQLVERGLVVRGPGPGGTLRRAESELGGEDEEQDEAEGSAALSRQEKKLLSLIPEDGSTINNRVLREQTGWTDERYEQVREQLVERGLVVRGPGPGGTLRRAESEQGGEDETESNAALSSQQNIPPGRGRGIGVYRTEGTKSPVSAATPKPPPVSAATPKPPPVSAATPKPPPVSAATPKPPPVSAATPKPPPVSAATPKPPPVSAATPKRRAEHDTRHEYDERPAPKRPIKIFIAYVQSDEQLKKELLEHLRPLEKSKLIEIWHDHMITPGEDWKGVLHQNLQEADLIMFLISPIFINSDYCNGDEMETALARHKSGEAVVVPIILRPCLWQLNRVLSRLRALPKDDMPVTKWSDRDDALANIAHGIYDTVQKLLLKL
ncbi:TIR domain-containing protein [Sorangium sp. So ce1182]|uniref:toll/interleukin-1 receptor domain-containing protein n=1 Tax=Sorangium sp. So ce1182 TaxID=3133334 RepID=UPI003F612FAA